MATAWEVSVHIPNHLGILPYIQILEKLLPQSVSYLLLCNKLLKTEWLKTTINIYYSTVSMGQEFRSVSCKVAVQMLAGAPVICLTSAEGSTSKMLLSHDMHVGASCWLSHGAAPVSSTTLLALLGASDPREQGGNSNVFITQSGNSHITATLCWSHRRNPIQCGKGLHRGMNHVGPSRKQACTRRSIEDMYDNIHRSIICSDKELQATQVFILREV